MPYKLLLVVKIAYPEEDQVEVHMYNLTAGRFDEKVFSVSIAESENEAHHAHDRC